MKNISKVIWSAEAVENLEKIISYLEEQTTEWIQWHWEEYKNNN